MTGRRSAGWRVERYRGPAAVLLEPWPPAESQGGPVVRIARVTGRSALVLGSTQDRVVIDNPRAAAAGVDVVRRTTGGGAVLVAPDAQVWLDLWVPRRHDLWNDDIVDAATWVGVAWMRALEGLGAIGLRVHQGPATRTAWSDLICFAGLGPGEVHVAPGPSTGGDGRAPTVPSTGAAGAKVMGLAQRRTRAGARFHTTAPLTWDAPSLLALLTTGVAAGREDAPASWSEVAVGLRALVTSWPRGVRDDDVLISVEDAVIATLP